MLLPDDVNPDKESKARTLKNDVQQAPIIAGEMLNEDYIHLVPQYGFLGVHEKSKLFVNTNIPFSAFICGVQGSGKSHTASCLMENALISSHHLGHLENPLSALVFSYSPFSGEGVDFNISEAAFLARAGVNLPPQSRAKKVTVLVSPTNWENMKRLYSRIPNVKVVPFRIRPEHLDVEAILTLMAVDPSEQLPLYMSDITRILREFARMGGRGINWKLFRTKLDRCDHNPAQKAMLNLRLGLLEEFLDKDNKFAQPQFHSGEITIMDMSCPFVDPNTACVLFKLGLQRYLHSDVPGKMVVLDEAHKYMLKVPGATKLSEHIQTLVRMERHYGVRVIISTQEPTLLTDLIALCSITIVHRFGSPEWLAALKKHIPITMMDQDERELMRDIERLRTGTVLVYSSKAVLGIADTDDKELIKGSGKMLKVSVRKRLTSDGGRSVLAV